MSTVLSCYLLGWVMTTIGLALVVRKLNDRVAPQPHPVPLAVAAGAAWPLVLVGATQFVTVAIVVNTVRRRTSDRRPHTTVEFDELLACSDEDRVSATSVGLGTLRTDESTALGPPDDVMSPASVDF
jgi:hypothetical protein